MAKQASRTVAIGYDGSENSEDGLALGRLLAEAFGATPVVVTVAPYLDHIVAREKLESAIEELNKDLFARARERLKGLDVETRAIADDSAAHGLSEFAENEGPLALVVGSSHRGPVGRIVLGSVGESLLSGVPCALAVAPRGLAESPQPSLNRIGVAVDESDESRVALKTGISIAERSRSRFNLLSVAEPVGYGYSTSMGAISGQELETAEKRLKAEVLEEAIKSVPDDLPVESRLLSGDPPEAIASAAKDLDLLIVGSRGYGPVRRVLLGGFSARVIRSAPCPVLVLPRAAGEDPLSLDAGA